MGTGPLSSEGRGNFLVAIRQWIALSCGAPTGVLSIISKLLMTVLNRVLPLRLGSAVKINSLRKADLMVMKKIFTIIAIWGALMVFCALVGEVSVAADNGVASADFLNIGVGGRATGMGGAYTAAANDASSGYWNPAGLTGIESSQITLSHISWYQDINYEYLGAARHFGEKLSLGVSASYLSYGSIEGYDINDLPTGEISSTYNLAAGVSMGYELLDNVSTGVTVKYVAISLAGTGASAVAADFGLKIDLLEQASIGVAVSNIGQKLKFDNAEEDLPSNIRAGVAIYPFGPGLVTALDVEKQFEGDIILRNGIEVGFDRYFLRSGYSYYPDSDNDPLGQGFSFGAGANLGPAQFDYTYSPDSRVSSQNIHRFSITFALGH